jgi:hypothetical protein
MQKLKKMFQVADYSICVFIYCSLEQGRQLNYCFFSDTTTDKPTSSENMNRKIKLIRVEIVRRTKKKKKKKNCLYLHFLRTKIM